VLVNEQKVDKPGASVAAEAAVRLLGEDLKYVSRGGLKLEGALDHWKIAVEGRACIDIGTSTGGFTDCLLQRGAASVTDVDTGFGQIAMKLRNDPRVRLMERTNARLLEPGSLGSDASLRLWTCRSSPRPCFLNRSLRLRPGWSKQSSLSSRNSKPAGKMWAKVALSATPPRTVSPSTKSQALCAPTAGKLSV
jgi:hypothetical protein